MAIRREETERGLYRCDSCGLFFNFNQVREVKETVELYPHLCKDCLSSNRTAIIYRYICYRCEAAEENFGIKETEEKDGRNKTD